MRSVKNTTDDIAVTIDSGQQPDMFTGCAAQVDVKRDCKLIKPTLFDYQRETELLNKLKGEMT
jgi:hypothetical protein